MNTSENKKEISIEFTIDEIVKLLSCCNHAIVSIEDQIHEKAGSESCLLFCSYLISGTHPAASGRCFLRSWAWWCRTKYR